MKIIFRNNSHLKGSIKYYIVSFSRFDKDILNLDRAGRVISFISINDHNEKVTYKKSFDGSWLGIKRSSGSGIRIRNHLSNSEIQDVYLRIGLLIDLIIENLKQSEKFLVSYDSQDVYKNENFKKVIDFWISVLRKISLKQNEDDFENFRKYYSNIGILPPDRYGSLVLQVTIGCVYNKCSFCKLYEGIQYNYKLPDQFEEHIDDINSFMGDSLGRFHSIFLGDANALTIPYMDLLEIFRIINTRFSIRPNKISFFKKKTPIFEGIYSFLDVFTGFKLTTDNFKELALLNLRMVYLGIESGCPSVLKLLNKPNTEEKILKIIDSLHEASIGVSVIFLVGAGGKTLEEKHIKDSISLIKKMKLRTNDIVYLSKLFAYEKYNKIMNDKDIIQLTEDELEEQFQIFKEQLGKYYLTQEFKPILTRYELLDFVY